MGSKAWESQFNTVIITNMKLWIRLAVVTNHKPVNSYVHSFDVTGQTLANCKLAISSLLSCGLKKLLKLSSYLLLQGVVIRGEVPCRLSCQLTHPLVIINSSQGFRQELGTFFSCLDWHFTIRSQIWTFMSNKANTWELPTDLGEVKFHL